jgi:hypothetical protein
MEIRKKRKRIKNYLRIKARNKELVNLFTLLKYNHKIFFNLQLKI